MTPDRDPGRRCLRSALASDGRYHQSLLDEWLVRTKRSFGPEGSKASQPSIVLRELLLLAHSSRYLLCPVLAQSFLRPLPRCSREQRRCFPLNELRMKPLNDLGNGRATTRQVMGSTSNSLRRLARRSRWQGLRPDRTAAKRARLSRTRSSIFSEAPFTPPIGPLTLVVSRFSLISAVAIVGPTIDQRFRVKAFSFRFKRLDGGVCSSSIASLLPWCCVAGLDEFVQYRRHTRRLFKFRRKVACCTSDD